MIWFMRRWFNLIRADLFLRFDWLNKRPLWSLPCQFFFFFFDLAITLIIILHSYSEVHKQSFISAALTSLSQTPIPFRCSHRLVALSVLIERYISGTHFIWPNPSIRNGLNNGWHDSLKLNGYSHGWMVNSYNHTYEFILIIGSLPLFICSPLSYFLPLLLR